MRSYCMRQTLVISLAVLLFNPAKYEASARTSRIKSNKVTFRPHSSLESVAMMSDSPSHDALSGETLLATRGGASSVSSTLPNALAGAVVFALIERAINIGLQAAGIKYPAMLGGCILLFAAMCVTDAVAPAKAARLYEALTPGAAILAKWFPVFFVPGLAMLPLSPPIGGTTDILKIILTVSIGFVYSMATTLGSIAVVRGLQGRSPPAVVNTRAPRLTSWRCGAKAAAPKPKQFSDEQFRFCWMGSVVTGLFSIAATNMDSAIASPVQMIFTMLLSVGSYIWGTRLPAGFVKVVHPLVTSSVILLCLLRGLAVATGREFLHVLSAYKVGSLNPMKAGAADYLMYVLGPSVVSFAVSMFGRRNLLFNNLPMVLTAMIVSSAGGLFATGAFVRLIHLGGNSGSGSALVRLSILGRNVTTALAMALTEMVGGDLSIVAAVVCLTGILGASYGVSLLDALGIKDPICRGLGIGSAAQGLGVAALSEEPDAFAFASVAMVLTAVAATSLASIPVVRSALIKVTTGQSAPFMV